MIARKQIKEKYIIWNKKWGSPYGLDYSPKPTLFTTLPLTRLIRGLKVFDKHPILSKLLGMFAFEQNNSNRAFEYPWAFYATSLTKNMKVLEIGGAFSGFQFVLAKHVFEVVNIDPLDNLQSKQYYKNKFSNLNNAFNTQVKLITAKINQTKLTENYFDRIYCISVLEHLDQKDRKDIMENAYRLLKTGCYFIITVDLFLDLFPFSDKSKNKFGTNISIKELIKETPFKLYFGKTSELFGFPDFNQKQVLANLSDYLIAQTYPILTQTLILQKI